MKKYLIQAIDTDLNIDLPIDCWGDSPEHAKQRLLAELGKHANTIKILSVEELPEVEIKNTFDFVSNFWPAMLIVAVFVYILFIH